MNNLLMEVENEVAVVTINRPKSLNALNSETLAELDQCFGENEAEGHLVCDQINFCKIISLIKVYVILIYALIH